MVSEETAVYLIALLLQYRNFKNVLMNHSVFHAFLCYWGKWGKFSPPAPSVEVQRAENAIGRTHDKCLYIATYLHN